MSIDEEFSALLEEHYWLTPATDVRTDWPDYVQKMLAVCRRILDNRVRGGKEQGAHYWARQVAYWEKEA